MKALFRSDCFGPAQARRIPRRLTHSIKSLAAPLTVNTIPEATLKAFDDHGEVGSRMPADGGDSETVLERFGRAGINLDNLASQLQDEGAKSL